MTSKENETKDTNLQDLKFGYNEIWSCKIQYESDRYQSSLSVDLLPFDILTKFLNKVTLSFMTYF